MNELPELVLEHILSYVDNKVCCRNKNELSVMVSNKYMCKFYKSHFKYTFHSFVDLSEFKKDLWFNSNKAPRDFRFCLSPYKCNLLTPKEIHQLKNIMYRYMNFKNKTFTSILKDGKTIPTMNTHSDSKRELDNFITKMQLLNSNIWFNSSRCCEGSGCEIDVVKTYPWHYNY